MSIKSRFHQVTTADGDMDVFYASKGEESLAPVLIVCQEAFGVNHHIQGLCERFADQGYLAIAPEFYHRKGKHLEFKYTDLAGAMPQLKSLDAEEVIEDLESVLKFLRNELKIQHDNINIIGFCVGGYISVLASIKMKFKSAVAFYGGGLVKERSGFKLTPLINQLKLISHPIFFVFGDQDSSIPQSEIEEIKNKLTQEHVGAQVKVYKNAGHGFFCNERSSYHEESAREAWRDTLDFLKGN